MMFNDKWKKQSVIENSNINNKRMTLIYKIRKHLK
jgi:hypothetical protein